MLHQFYKNIFDSGFDRTNRNIMKTLSVQMSHKLIGIEHTIGN